MYQIMGKYRNSKYEVIDEFETMLEAKRMLSEYAVAFGVGWLFKIKKVG